MQFFFWTQNQFGNKSPKVDFCVRYFFESRASEIQCDCAKVFDPYFDLQKNIQNPLSWTVMLRKTEKFVISEASGDYDRLGMVLLDSGFQKCELIDSFCSHWELCSNFRGFRLPETIYKFKKNSACKKYEFLRNVAENLCKLHFDPTRMSLIGTKTF